MRTIHTFYGMTADISDEVISTRYQDIFPFRSLSQMLEKFAELDALYVRKFLNARGCDRYAHNIRMLEAHGYSDQKNRFMYADLEEGKLVWAPVEH